MAQFKYYSDEETLCQRCFECDRTDTEQEFCDWCEEEERVNRADME